MNYLDYFK